MIGGLAYLVLGVSPKWTAKFVPHLSLGTHLCVLDCRRDLSIVGYGYSLMIDVVPCSPLAIIRGHGAELEREDDKRLWGFHLTNVGYNAAESDYPLFGDARSKTWNPKAVTVAFPGMRETRSESKVPKNPKVKDGLTRSTQESFSTWPADLSPELGRREEKLYDPGITVHWFETEAKVRVGNGNYQPVTPGYEDARMHDTDKTIAVIKANDKVYPLRTFVSNAKGLLFDEVVWWSSDGWFVCRGSLGGESGLIWLYSSRRR